MSELAHPERPPSEPVAKTPDRLLSLDALRGFDMAFIIGFGAALKALAESAGWTAIAAQFEHVKWAGFHLEDLIFPMFVFIAGMSLTFSLPRAVARLGRNRAALRLFKRCFILFLLGIFASRGLDHGIEKVRWLGVLQRIALASLGAGLLYLYTGTRALIVSTVVLLVGYWVMFLTIPHSDAGAVAASVATSNGEVAPRYQEGVNFVNQFDARWLPGRKYDGDHDPEGIVSTIPAIANALLGILAGLWLQAAATRPRKAALLAVGGAASLALGWLWGMEFPVIKKLWTSSFVLVAVGWSALIMAFFYWLVEIQGWRRWTAPWVWIGMNPITLYLLAGIVSFGSLGQRLTGPVTAPWVPPLVAFALILLVARFFYRRQVFLRV